MSRYSQAVPEREEESLPVGFWARNFIFSLVLLQGAATLFILGLVQLGIAGTVALLFAATCLVILIGLLCWKPSWKAAVLSAVCFLVYWGPALCRLLLSFLSSL
jgi:hypothetical protein